jgi:hydroxyacylglutathione hydrolase
MMKVLTIPVTPFQQNCSLLICEQTGRAAVVDPGGELDVIVGAADNIGATIEKILVTHAHIDHAGGVAELAERLGVPIEGPHRDDQFWIDKLAEQSQRFGFPPSRAFTPDRWLDNGDEVTVGKVQLQVIHCPGHTPGHVVFYQPQARFAVVGDVLFRGSIGRTDFPRGDFDSLVQSIRRKLFPLGDDVQFVPGHGPTSTFGIERAHNPFVGDAA